MQLHRSGEPQDEWPTNSRNQPELAILGLGAYLANARVPETSVRWNVSTFLCRIRAQVVVGGEVAAAQ